MPQTSGLTRRGVLLFVSGAFASSRFRLYAGNSDFWNKKEPAEWSSDEVDKLVSKSPWAKPVIAESAALSRPYGTAGAGGGMGDPGIGGGGAGYPGGTAGPGGSGGYGGIGGRGPRGGANNGQMPISYNATVRWESAKPIREALKAPLPEEFANAYVISVSGVPVLEVGRQHSDDGDTTTTVSRGLSDEVLDRIKELTYLEPKGKSPAQPSAVRKGTPGSSGTPTLLFGFPREVLPLTADDKDVTFTTQLGRIEVRTRFSLKDMMYHKELAL